MSRSISSSQLHTPPIARPEPLDASEDGRRVRARGEDAASSATNTTPSPTRAAAVAAASVLCTPSAASAAMTDTNSPSRANSVSVKTEPAATLSSATSSRITSGSVGIGHTAPSRVVRGLRFPAASMGTSTAAAQWELDLLLRNISDSTTRQRLGGLPVHLQSRVAHHVVTWKTRSVRCRPPIAGRLEQAREPRDAKGRRADAQSDASEAGG